MKEAGGSASEKELRLLAVTQKQDKLLYLCAYLLLNLSEDPDIERKMQKKVCPQNIHVAVHRTFVDMTCCIAYFSTMDWLCSAWCMFVLLEVVYRCTMLRHYDDLHIETQ